MAYNESSDYRIVLIPEIEQIRMLLTEACTLIDRAIFSEDGLENEDALPFLQRVYESGLIQKPPECDESSAI